jgi:hypothetical protein
MQQREVSMRFFSYAFLFLILSQRLYATDGDSQIWKHQFESLGRMAGPEQAKEQVLLELALWGPDQTCSYWKFPLWFRDLYLHDESFRGLVRAYFIPDFMNSWEKFPMDTSFTYPHNMSTNVEEITILALRIAPKLPSLLCAEKRAEILGAIKWKDCAKSCAAQLGHWSALASSAISHRQNPYKGNALLFFAALGTSQLFNASHLIFASATAYLAMDGDFIDVALRSLKRKYELQQKWEEYAVVSMMIAHLAKNKLENNSQ